MKDYKNKNDEEISEIMKKNISNIYKICHYLEKIDSETIKEQKIEELKKVYGLMQEVNYLMFSNKL
jgi:hypothetical protein